MNISFNEKQVQVCCDNATRLSVVSFGIESASLWFMGRTCWRLVVTHSQTADGHQFTVTAPGQTLGQLDWSPYTELGTLINCHKFPVTLVMPFSPSTGAGKSTGHGTARKFRGTAGDHETVICMEQLNPQTTIVALAYAFSDTCVEFFKRGATVVKAQWSVRMSEVAANVGLNKLEFSELVSMKPSYGPAETTAALKIWTPHLS